VVCVRFRDTRQAACRFALVTCPEFQPRALIGLCGTGVGRFARRSLGGRRGTSEGPVGENDGRPAFVVCFAGTLGRSAAVNHPHGRHEWGGVADGSGRDQRVPSGSCAGPKRGPSRGFSRPPGTQDGGPAGGPLGVHGTNRWPDGVLSCRTDRRSPSLFGPARLVDRQLYRFPVC